MPRDGVRRGWGFLVPESRATGFWEKVKLG